MIRTKSCRCVMLRVTSLWIRLILLEITSLWTYTLSYPPTLIEHTHRVKLFPLVYKLWSNKVISLGLQTLNPQQNVFPQTSDYTIQKHQRAIPIYVETSTWENTIKTSTIGFLRSSSVLRVIIQKIKLLLIIMN